MDRPPEYMDALFKMYPGKWCWAFPSGIIDYENMVWHDEEIPKPTKRGGGGSIRRTLDAEYPWEEFSAKNATGASPRWIGLPSRRIQQVHPSPRSG